jgi:hypothetical protein
MLRPSKAWIRILFNVKMPDSTLETYVDHMHSSLFFNCFRNLVLGFRTSELCQLMNFAGKSKVGNKAELQVTLTSLLVSVSDPD